MQETEHISHILLTEDDPTRHALALAHVRSSVMIHANLAALSAPPRVDEV